MSQCCGQLKRDFLDEFKFHEAVLERVYKGSSWTKGFSGGNVGGSLQRGKFLDKGKFY